MVEAAEFRVRRMLVPVITLMVLLGGCVSIGPRSVSRDRFDYNSAVSSSWQEQTLLNIVKIRYADMPLFIEVASIVAGYTLEGEISGGASFPASRPDTFDVGARGKFIDRPTITYEPLTGQRFNLSFMTPIPPSAVLFLLQTGWPAELVLPLALESINGLRSRDSAGLVRYEGDEGFVEVIQRIANVQRSAGIGMQIIAEESKNTAVMTVRRDTADEALQRDLDALDRLLGLDPEATEFNVSYGAVASADNEIAMITRSLLHIMIQMAVQVEVPEEDVREGRTLGTRAASGDGPTSPGSLRVKWSDQRPESAFVAVEYRGRWFYIDDRDFNSKRAFTFLMILISLQQTDSQRGQPIVTIPS